MAHDVWLLRSTLLTCLMLGAFAGTAIATNGNQIAPCDIKDRKFASGVQNILIKDDSIVAGYQTKPKINFARSQATTARIQVQSENVRLADSFGRLETKRSINEGTKETGARKTRMHILDKYFVHPEIMKEAPSDRNSSDNDRKTSLSALVLEGPKRDAEGNRELRSELPNVEKYGAASVEGTKIVSAASLLENSVKSHSAGYQEQKIGNIPPASYVPTQSTNVRLRTKFKERYRFVNSFIRPQLAGISDDLNDLEALRNRAKLVNLKTLKNDFKSHKLESDGQFNEGSASFGVNTLKNFKNDESEHNTKQEAEPQYNTDDTFLLGTPDKSSYFENAFMANPTRQNSRATTSLKEGEISNVAFGNFRGDSDTTDSGLEGLAHSEDEVDSDEIGLGPDARFKAALTLATQTDTKINKATTGLSLLSFKDKAMSHIEEQSNDMYNEAKEDYDAGYSRGNDSVEAQRVNPSLYFSPTKKRGFPKPTTFSSYRRTTIPHRKFGSQYVHQTSFSGSGEGTGIGEYHIPPNEKQKYAHRIRKVSLSAKKKSHAGIFGAQDKATIKKCERMGKADYRDKCPPGWLPFDQFCYLFVTKSSGKWEEFPQKCNEENGLLAMPKTDKELKFLQDKISSSKLKRKYFYIGLKKKSGIWTWVDDVPYTRDVHVKDDLGDKNCAGLSKDGVHMATCSKPKAGYICEIRTGVEVFHVLAFGDSLTNGFHSDDKSHTPYAKTLEYLLNKDIHRCYTVTTLAKDGTEAAEMSNTLQNHLREGKSKYSWVIILAGTNDIAHNSETRYRKAWDTAVEHIINLHITSHRYGAKTVAVTIPEMDCEESRRPPCLHTHLERKYINEKLRYYARSNEFTLLCDLALKFPRYSLSSEERKLMWEVGVHMKPVGYERMAEIIYKDLLPHV